MKVGDLVRPVHKWDGAHDKPLGVVVAVEISQPSGATTYRVFWTGVDTYMTYWTKNYLEVISESR